MSKEKEQTERRHLPVSLEQEEITTSFMSEIFQALMDIRSAETKLPTYVSPIYLDIQQALIANQENGVTSFLGGPLDLVEFEIDDSWLIPVESRDEEGFCNFHIIALNCKDGSELANAEVFINLAPEREIKVGNETNKSTKELRSLLLERGKEPTIIIRPSVTGSLAFPLITTPVDLPETAVIIKRLKNMISTMGLKEPDLNDVDFSEIENQRFELMAEFENFWLSEPQKIESPTGLVWVYGVFSLEDPWRYYEIFCFEDINEIRKKPKVTMRTDSGCDIGMLYHDQGCDCHDQLLRALQEAKQEHGIVVHIPTQDGRGYGMNTKIETEAHKRGMVSVFNPEGKQMKTLTAAKRLFGEGFHDIRTYDGVATMLKELGFREISLITDNRLKLTQMRKTGLKINIKETNTMQHVKSEHLKAHLHEKHTSNDYLG